IDLQRAGNRVPVDGELPRATYFLFVSRSGRRPNVGIWPVQLHDRLPVLPVPLKRPDPDVPLDLQAIVDSIYDRSNYDMLINYTKALSGPLTISEKQYVASRVAEHTAAAKS